MYESSTVLDLIIDIAVLPIPKKTAISQVTYHMYRQIAKYRCPQITTLSPVHLQLGVSIRCNDSGGIVAISRYTASLRYIE